MSTSVWEIRAAAEGEARDRVKKVNKRIVKAGLAPFTFTVAARWTIKETEDSQGYQYAVPRTVEMIRVEIGGAPPSFGGWSFMASVEEIGTGVVVNTMPGVESVPAEHRTRPGECDHCKTQRFRKKVYVVRHEDGRTLQVGSTCIEGFLGFRAPGLFMAEKGVGEAEEGWGRAGGPRGYATEGLLELAARLIRRYGWVSKAAAEVRGVATAERVRGILENWPRDWAAEMRREIAGVEPVVDVALVTPWVEQEAALPGASEYMLNLAVILSGESVADRHIGYAVSAVSSYVRATQRAAERKKAAAESTWIGTVKGKVTIEVEVTGVSRVESYYGSSDLIVGVTDTGARVKTFTTSMTAPEKAGGRWKVTGTVKEHAEWRGVRETVLTRAKWEEVAATAAA